MAKAKAKTKTPPTDYDGLYHKLFQRPAMVSQLIGGFVEPSLLADLDLDGMTMLDSKFHARTGQRRISDMVWRIPRGDGDHAYLVLLLEFQSTDERYMAVRMATYAVLLWQRVISRKELNAGGKLPPLLPVVLYNGGARWRAPERLAELVALPPESPLWRLQPNLAYHLIDIGAFSRTDLDTRDGLVPLWFRLENADDEDQLSEAYEALMGWFADHPGYSDEAEVFGDLLRALFTRLDPDMPVPGNPLETRNMLVERVEQWIADGKLAGRQEGLQEGLQKGEAAMLLRLLEGRFGALPDAVRQRVQAADLAMLQTWGMRILDAESLDGVFADRPA